MPSRAARWHREPPSFEELHYDLQPSLVFKLTWAHHHAGRVAGMRFSHYGLKRLQADAGKRRITSMVYRSGVRGAAGVTFDDVMHVVAGGLLPPRKRPTMDLIRRAGVLCVARACDELCDQLLSYQDKEERLPWLMVRPPDELDRQIYDIIEQLGAARCKQIYEELRDPSPLRTLQRRLQRLAQDGLVSKHGGRKNAYYRIAEHS
jgi:hypothetical protein